MDSFTIIFTCLNLKYSLMRSSHTVMTMQSPIIYELCIRIGFIITYEYIKSNNNNYFTIIKNLLEEQNELFLKYFYLLFVLFVSVK